MPWCSKLFVISTILVLAMPSFGQQYVFNGASSRAEVKAHLVQSRDNGLHPVEIRVSVPSIDVDRIADGFDQISAPGLVPMDQLGSPDLFTTGSLIAVPAGYNPVLNVVAKEVREVANVTPVPAQRKLRCASPQDESFAFNAALYESKEVFPRSAITMEEAGSLQGLRLVRVGFYPIQMDFNSKSLTVTTDLTVRVSFEKTGEVAPVRLTKMMADIARTVPVNGGDLGDLVANDKSELILVVAADSLADAMQPYAAWKRAQGFKVQMVKFTTAGGTNEKVRDYIKNLYNTADLKPSYLLFVGNKDTMPGYMESTASGSAATDYTYALLTKDATGKDSNVPAIAYGRFVANDVKELQTILNRAMNYERNPAKGAEWYHDATTIASNEGSGPSDKEYAEQVQEALMKSGTYKTADKFYQGDSNATSANIMKSMSAGRTWMAYFGHGSGTSWGSTNDTFDNTTVAKLENVNRLPVIIDVACQNGSWVKLSKCFGKAWVTQEKGGEPAGAVAFYGGSVNISWHEPAIMSVGVAKYHFEKPLYTIGASVLAGQLYLIEKKGNTSATIDNVKWYNLFGDPAMMVRTNTPVAYKVKESVKSDTKGTTIVLSAIDANGNGLKGVVASVHSTKATAPLAVGTTDANGKATLTVSGVTELEPGTMLTTTGYNLETNEIELGQ